MKNKEWSDDKIKKLLDLYKSGISFDAIGKEFGKTRNAISLKIGKLKKAGTVFPSKTSANKETNKEGVKSLKFNWTPELEKEVTSVEFTREQMDDFCARNNVKDKVVLDKRHTFSKKNGIKLSRLKRKKVIVNATTYKGKRSIISQKRIEGNEKFLPIKEETKLKGKLSSYDKDGHCKRFIQELFAGMHAGLSCNVIGLFGREGLGQYNILRKYNILGTNNHFRSYENDAVEWKLQTQFLFENRKSINNVVIQPGDIFSCPPDRYMDFDLCNTFTNSIKEQLRVKFLEQKNSFVDRKAFQLTTSIWGVTKDYDKTNDAGYIKHIENGLSDILGVRVKVVTTIHQSLEKDGKSYKIKEYVIKTLNNRSSMEIKAYSYSDSTPMMTFSVRYW